MTAWEASVCLEIRDAAPAWELCSRRLAIQTLRFVIWRIYSRTEKSHRQCCRHHVMPYGNGRSISNHDTQIIYVNVKLFVPLNYFTEWLLCVFFYFETMYNDNFRQIVKLRLLFLCSIRVRRLSRSFQTSGLAVFISPQRSTTSWESPLLGSSEVN